MYRLQCCTCTVDPLVLDWPYSADHVRRPTVSDSTTAVRLPTRVDAGTTTLRCVYCNVQLNLVNWSHNIACGTIGLRRRQPFQRGIWRRSSRAVQTFALVWMTSMIGCAPADWDWTRPRYKWCGSAPPSKSSRLTLAFQSCRRTLTSLSSHALQYLVADTQHTYSSSTVVAVDSVQHLTGCASFLT